MRLTGIEDFVEGGQSVLGFPELVLLRRVHRRRAEPPLAPHRHAADRVEFIYVAKGRQTYLVGTQRYELQTDDCTIAANGSVEGVHETAAGAAG